MSAQIVHWHPVICLNDIGEPIPSPMASIIDIEYRRQLLHKANAMPKKAAIKFEDAIRMADSRVFKADIDQVAGLYYKYVPTFLDWLSEEGYHIEFTGDEFETLITPTVDS
jgi:hypothetical protein